MERNSAEGFLGLGVTFYQHKDLYYSFINNKYGNFLKNQDTFSIKLKILSKDQVECEKGTLMTFDFTGFENCCS